MAKIITNADRIRSMTDEELVEFLDEVRCRNCMRRMNSCFPGSFEDWLRNFEDWLRKPIESEDEEG